MLDHIHGMGIIHSHSEAQPSGSHRMPHDDNTSGECAVHEKTIIVMPAYNAERTLERVFRQIPEGCYDEIIIVDDGSRDRTVAVAQSLPVTLLRHDDNRGYGGNQKTCYRAALDAGATYIVMLHPDYQYDARIIPSAVDILRLEICDVIIGNRIRTRKEALSGGMPLSKYLSNRGLSLMQGVLTGQNLGEWHTGFRAYRREVLEKIPFHRNSDDFVFDSQVLLQVVQFGFKLGDLPVPVLYHGDASSIQFSRSTRYALLTLWTLARWIAHRTRVFRCALFESEIDETRNPDR
jgi:glycosyltransferase involved in cell wall biosynthesis